MNKSKIFRDTCFLTVIDLALQGLSLLLNVFITRKLGSSVMGMISLISTFFSFATIVSSGNIYLSSSRFISEEIGKKDGNPGRVFNYGIISSVGLSVITSSVIFIFSKIISINILKTDQMIIPIRILALILPFGSVSACIKGYFNAIRNVTVAAAGGTLEFLIKSGLFAFFAEFCITEGKINVLTAFALSIAAGQIFSCIFLILCYLKFRRSCNNDCSIGFKWFVMSSVPIFLNSIVTSVLSSTNDALVPLTLKQYGNSTAEALSQFGIFEAIVIPALFFPSSILCSLSSILVPELSRERGADNNDKNVSLINKVLRQTFSFSIFIAVIFLCFGKEIGYLMSGDYFAGKIITILSPAVPFIYLEIILEGILKGMGKHSFSSLNYLVEYTIRISVLLICVPIFGFYGIVISYLTSNIVCNTTRLIMIIKITRIHFSFTDNLIIPIISAVFSIQIIAVIDRLTHLDRMNVIAETVIFALLTMIVYIIIQKTIYKLIDNRTGTEAKI
ncbi:oligosaccharide flippase family protein [Porcipelethomonas sp.]|uniref:oligosaccharide flippase family protein n=1 Tax=Porcipelethomonas sp. TaxID=2981675 RepID=UPI003EF1A4CC